MEKKIYLKVYELLIRVINVTVYKYLLPTPKILTVEESIVHIIKTKKSVSRYGDGELWCLMGGSIRYQNSDPLMAKRLKEIISSQEEEILICLPDVFNNNRLNIRNPENQMFWKKHLAENRFNWYRNINWHRTYLNTALSRFYIPFIDKSKSEKNSILLKKIWENKDVLIVEGEKSRLGVGNDLFSQAKSISRIICPSENAFIKYSEILKTIKKYNKRMLILIALGPTATILAYDLGVEGYWAIDIGHIDLEYEWLIRGAKRQIKIEGKYVNEVTDGNIVNETLNQDNIYWKQIKQTII